MKHRLDLYGNAIDSLDEGLRRFRQGQYGDLRSFKYAVLHMAHFMELLLKHAVAQEHELLVLKNPATRNRATEATISLHEAVRILQNAGHDLQKDLVADLEWLKKLRNDIEHYSFDMDIRAVRQAIGRILRATSDFAHAASLTPLEESVQDEHKEMLTTLLDEYTEQLSNAQADAALHAGDRGDVTYCAQCGEQYVAVLEDQGLKCYFCDEIEPLLECAVCAETYRESETRVWNDDNPNEKTYICDFCYDNVFGPE